MSGFEITITNAGRAEVINAENNGTDPVLISEMGIGSGQYTPSPYQTALQSEIKRLTTIAGQTVSDDTIHVSGQDVSSDNYDVYEVGLYTASGTLFAVYAQSGTPILEKSAQSVALLAFDVILTTLDATSLTFGTADFANPPASETVMGVVELSDATEAKDDTENQTGDDPGAGA